MHFTDMKKLKIAAVLGLVVFSACNSGQKQEAASIPATDSTGAIPAPAAVTIDTLVYTMRHVEEKGDSVAWKGGEPHCSITYPEFQNMPSPLKDSLAVIYRKVLFNDHATAREMAKAFTGAPDEDLDGATSINWFSTLDVSVVGDNGKILSLEGVAEEYTGGAHGMHGTWFINLDRATGRQIELNDITSNLHGLSQLNEQYFRKEKGVDAQGSLKDAPGMLIEDDTLPLPGNFTFTKEGILMQYNVYEVMPYVAGPTTYVIPYAALDKVLKPEFKR
jgi:hypothetical protein